MRDAAARLTDAEKQLGSSSTLSSQLDSWTGLIVRAARDLATIAIQEAAGQDAKRLPNAQTEIFRGDASADSDPPDAIGHYKNAWKQATG